LLFNLKMKAINIHIKVNILLRIMNNKNQNIQFIGFDLQSEFKNYLRLTLLFRVYVFSYEICVKVLTYIFTIHLYRRLTFH